MAVFCAMAGNANTQITNEINNLVIQASLILHPAPIQPARGKWRSARLVAKSRGYHHTFVPSARFPQEFSFMHTVLDNQFSDIEPLTEKIKAWDLEFRLMKRGEFGAQLTQVAGPDLLITAASFGSRLHQSGSAPPGYRTFALPGEGCSDFWWLGYAVDDRAILRFGTDNELHAVSTEGFSVCTISIHQGYIDEISDRLGVSCPSTDRGVTRVAPIQMQALRRLVRSAMRTPGEHARRTAGHRFVESLLTYCAGGEQLRLLGPRSRDRAVIRVVDFLDQHGHSHPNLSELCKVAHVSERTLQYAFRERYELSPNQFVRLWQLNTARRQLLRTKRTDKSVATIAAQCGFHDPSVFSQHYRSLYGERPSTTMARKKSD